MNRLFLILLASIVMVLGACTESEEKEVKSVETSEKEKTDRENKSTEETSEEATDSENKATNEASQELDQTLVDNEDLTATVTGIKTIEDQEWDEERYEINIAIENKREDTIEVQAHEVSADNVMIDEMVFFSETVAGGKRANAVMVIENYDGDLPEMEENLEFVLNVFSHDDYDYEGKHDVKIEF